MKRRTLKEEPNGHPIPWHSMLALPLAALLSGCGDDSNPSATDASSAEPSSTTSVQAPVAGPVTLTETRLKLADVLGKTPPTVKQPGPCPFLSESTAIATAKVSSQRPLSRKRVSNDLCVWNYNSGFEVSVEVEPLETARPFSDVRYNMDSPPQLVEQDGPGSNATVLQDNTWGTARPYAFGFQLDQQSVLIRVTGLTTTPAQLRATADEVASTLPSAPTVEDSRYEEVPAFDQCTIWESESLRPLFAYTAQDSVSSRRRGKGCAYQFYQQHGRGGRLEASTNFYAMTDASFEKLKQRDDTELVSGYDLPVVQRVSTDDFGTYYSLIGYFQSEQAVAEVIVMDEQGERKKEATQLFNNLLARFE